MLFHSISNSILFLILFYSISNSNSNLFYSILCFSVLLYHIISYVAGLLSIRIYIYCIVCLLTFVHVQWNNNQAGQTGFLSRRPGRQKEVGALSGMCPIGWLPGLPIVRFLCRYISESINSILYCIYYIHIIFMSFFIF